MRAHILSNNVVVNTVMVDTLPHGMLDADLYPGGIGWTWDGEKLIAPPIPEPQPEPVPTEISNWQAKKQLLIEGAYEQVNSAISTMDVDAQVDWNHAAVFKRDYPLILQMQALLGRTDADTDAYFIAASKLQ